MAIDSRTADPRPGYQFQGWQDSWQDGYLDNPRTVVADWNKTYLATFVLGAGSAATITNAPSDASVVTGTDVSFRVAASGSTPLKYQWKHEQTDIPGATSALLSLPHVQPGDAGTYTVTVRNPDGTATASAHLAVATVTQARFSAATLGDDGAIHFTLEGLVGRSYQIEVSTDFKKWDPLVVLPNTFGVVHFSDAFGGGRRFYRASLLP